jgi:hypothetical protein
MTDHDLRIRLAEAQGWTDIMVPGPRPRMGEDVTGMPPEGHRPGYRTELPDPLEDDSDAAQLRAWCVAQGWNVVLNCYPDLAVVSVYSADDEFLAQAWAGTTEDLSTIQRERLATSRAVARAIQAPEVE